MSATVNIAVKQAKLKRITKWLSNYTNKSKKFKTSTIDTHTYTHFHTYTIL